MNRRTSLVLFSVVIGLLTACGRVIVDASELGDASGAGATGSGGAATTDATGTTGGTGGAGGEPAAGGEMCNLPPPPSPTPPKKGCGFNDMGIGWVSVPCLCELWMPNTLPTSTTAEITLTVAPPDQVPTLTGPLHAELFIDDPDASQFATWSKQPGNGVAFSVTYDKGKAVVRMGQSSVTLAAVPVAACTTRKATALVFGSDTVTMNMLATIDGGVASPTSEGTCLPPPKP